MEKIRRTLRKQFSGYGHFKISIEIDGRIYKTVTTNTNAIDCAFDDDYDLFNSTDRYFESQQEAQQTLVNEILRANALEV